MKPSKLYEALHALIGERVPLHIWGACGVGKSQIVAQVARDLGIAFLDVRAVQLDPVDLRGFPSSLKPVKTRAALPVVWNRTRATMSGPRLRSSPLLISLHRSLDTSV
jgi:MoxR-like ATPase